jgi:chromosome partitioning protein
MIISCANQKGGTGKTSTTALVAYELAKKGKKILVIDCDPQTNLTQLMTKTAAIKDGILVIDHTLFGMLIKNIPLEKGIKPVMPNLDFIPSASDLNMFSRWLDKQNLNEKEKVTYLYDRIAPLENKYDIIFLDVSPTMSLLNDNVFMTCDYIIIMLQTQERSLNGARDFIWYLQSNLIDQFNAKVNIIGVLPVLSRRGGSVDNEILAQAAHDLGEENIFKNKIMQMERVKRYDLTGITNAENSRWDNETHKAYAKVADEMLERVNNGTFES